MDLIIFIVALSILVLVHEFGHFFAARKTGVKVEEFGLGLPPRAIGKKIGKTIYSLNWLPIGGFCRLYGEDGEGAGTQAFNNKKPWQKLLIVLGGVLMNLVLAIVIFSVVYAIMGVPKESNQVKIIGVAKNTPAEKVGLKEGDWIKSVNGVEVKNPEELTNEVAKFKGKNVQLGVFDMVGGLFKGQIPKDVSGPVGMYEATSAIKNSQGILAVVHFFGVVSVNLAIVNILPFPALDGGRIIFVLYEMITRRKANQRVEAIVNNVGMLVLLSLIILITVGDVSRIFSR